MLAGWWWSSGPWAEEVKGIELPAVVSGEQKKGELEPKRIIYNIFTSFEMDMSAQGGQVDDILLIRTKTDFFQEQMICWYLKSPAWTSELEHFKLFFK